MTARQCIAKLLALFLAPQCKGLSFGGETTRLLSMVQKGFNSDVVVRGESYHVQTEDWGAQNPFLVTRVFKHGAVVKTIKTSYQEALRVTMARPEEGLKQALRSQHSRILDQLMMGEL